MNERSNILSLHRNASIFMRSLDLRVRHSERYCCCRVLFLLRYQKSPTPTIFVCFVFMSSSIKWTLWIRRREQTTAICWKRYTTPPNNGVQVLLLMLPRLPSAFYFPFASFHFLAPCSLSTTKERIWIMEIHEGWRELPCEPLSAFIGNSNNFWRRHNGGEIVCYWV